MKSIFRTDGIRGLANCHPITTETAMRVGMATGSVMRKGNFSHRVVIGKDTRLSGHMLEPALTAGFTAVGVDVFLLGPIPTPAVSMLTRSLRADMGVMITASHNPFHDNGFKLFGPHGFKLSGSLQEKIEELLNNESLNYCLAEPSKLGRTKRIDGVQGRYTEYAKRTLPRSLNLNGLRIVIDCANGAGYRVGPDVLWELGAEVFAIGVEPNGVNINASCGSTDIEALVRKVLEVRADIGMALDGDGDRIIMVDEMGSIIDDDQILATIARHWQQEDRLSSNSIAASIMSNLGLELYLKDQNLLLEHTPVGDRAVTEHMHRRKINLGGEQNGHIILSDYATSGDGLIAALQVLTAVKKADRPTSDICHPFEVVPQVHRDVPSLESSCLQSY